jgi:cysteine desulfurase/selenocysteine lyase
MSIRDDFPILNRKVNGESLVYLDNAATTQKPQVVITAMNDYYQNSNANVHRAVHTLAGEATEGYEACRNELKNWFNAERVIITSGTTESINLVAHAWARANLVAGDAVILTEMEHHSDIVPWQLLAQDIGIELRFVSLNEDLTLDLDAFEVSLVGAKIVACVHTSNVLGIRNPIEKIIEMSHANGAKVLLDSAQAVPHEKIDFKALDADFLACSAHKMCGPTGIGCLLVKEESFNQMQPFMGGGDMIQTVTTSGSTYQENEHKFEAGTPRIAEGVGWAAALNWLSKIDLHSEHLRLLEIARWTAQQIKDIPGMKVFGRHADGDSAVVSFIHDSVHPEDMARLLDARGIAIRTGHHCAQPLMQRLGVEGTMRVSFYLYNNQAEAELLIETMKGIVERFS